MKKRLAAEAQSSPRADGNAAKDVSGRFRFMCRAGLQVARKRVIGYFGWHLGCFVPKCFLLTSS